MPEDADRSQSGALVSADRNRASGGTPGTLPRRRAHPGLLIGIGVVVGVALAILLLALLRDSPGARLARAVDATLAQGTAETTITGVIRDVPLAGDVTLSVAEGELDMANERARLIRELPLLSGRSLPVIGEIGHVELLYADATAWLRGPFDVDRAWILVNRPEEQAASAPGLANPLALLVVLRAIEGTAEEVDGDEETVGGVSTTRYRVTVDLDALEAGLAPASRRLLDHLRTLHEDDRLPLDVWVDGDQLIRRIRYEIDLDLPALPTLRLATVVELDRHGLPVTIDPPDPGEVVDLSPEQLRELEFFRIVRELVERLPFVGG